MYDEHLERVKAAYLDGDVGFLYQALIDDEYFTEDELNLVTDVAGYSLRTLNDCIYSRYGYEDFEQLYDLDFEEDEEEDDDYFEDEEEDEEDDEEDEDEELEEDSEEDENLSYKGRLAKYASEVNEEDE